MRNRLIAFLLILALTGCATLTGKRTPLPEVQTALLGVTNDYLRSIAMGNTKQLEAMVYWFGYVEAKKARVSKAQYMQTVSALRDRWEPADHPLVGLAPVRVSSDDDDAEVVVRKANNPNAAEIRVVLVWSGNGWLVTNDNLIGEDGLLSKQLQSAPAAAN
jgi:hypothetical protein